MNRYPILAIILVALAFVGFNAFFIVDERQKAMVLQFGQVRAVKEEPGLAFKIPFIQNVVFYDSRIQGLETQALCAELTAFVEGRRLDDNAQLMLRFKGGAKGMIWASQVATGYENGLKLRVFGDKGGLEWRHENPNELIFSPLGDAPRRITRGGHGAGEAAARVTRIPAGHPEGYIEGFANIYSEIAEAIFAYRDGGTVDSHVSFPTGLDGEMGIVFIDAAVRSSAAGGSWVEL